MTVFLPAVISAALTSLSLIFKPLALAAFFSLTPFFYIMYNAAAKKTGLCRVYLYGFIWALVYYIINYHWFVFLYPMEFMGVTPLEAVGIIAVCWLGLSLFQAVGTAFLSVVFRLSFHHKFLSPILFACIWTLFEYIQTLTWAGVPWARLALSQTGFLPALQSASLFGSLFVSFIIVLINGYLALAFIEFKSHGIRARSVQICAAIALAVFTANTFYGLASMALYRDNEDQAVKVALIQGNISSNEKWSISGQEALELYIDMTYEAVFGKDAAPNEERTPGDVDYVLWPETVINFTLTESESSLESVKKLAKDTGAVIFVGTFDTKSDKEYNAIIAFYPDGSVDENPYYKRHLVPFGEYLPMKGFIKTFLPMLADMNMFESELTPGKDSAIIRTENGDIGRLICFDSIYQSLARQSVADGAQIIMLSTNDSWYTDSAAVYQHNAHAVLRAIENRRYIVRAANTGISSVITPTGDITSYLPPLVDGYMTEEVYMRDTRTLYSYIGDVFEAVCASFVLFELFYAVKEKKGRRKSKAAVCS